MGSVNSDWFNIGLMVSQILFFRYSIELFTIRVLLLLALKINDEV